MALVKRTQKFLDKTKKERPDIEVLGKYQGSNKKILVKCTNCFHEWDTTPNNIRIGIGCPTCFSDRLSKKLTYSNKTFQSKLANINPNYTTQDTYDKSTTKMTFHCSIHDHYWIMRASPIRKDSCKKCKQQNKIDEIHQNILELNPTIELLTDYIDCSASIKWRCMLDNHIQYSKPTSLKSGNISCHRCKKRKQFHEILDEIAKLSPTLMFLDDILDSDEPTYVQYEGQSEAIEDTPSNILKKLKNGQTL